MSSRAKLSMALKSDGSVRHDVGFSGNLLVLDRRQVKSVVQGLRTLRGEPHPKVESTVQNGPVSNLIEGITFGDKPVDAVMVYMDPARTSAEMIVLPSSIPNVSITGRG